MLLHALCVLLLLAISSLTVHIHVPSAEPGWTHSFWGWWGGMGPISPRHNQKLLKCQVWDQKLKDVRTEKETRLLEERSQELMPRWVLASLGNKEAAGHEEIGNSWKSLNTAFIQLLEGSCVCMCMHGYTALNCRSNIFFIYVFFFSKGVQFSEGELGLCNNDSYSL